MAKNQDVDTTFVSSYLFLWILLCSKDLNVDIYMAQGHFTSQQQTSWLQNLWPYNCLTTIVRQAVRVGD